MKKTLNVVLAMMLLFIGVRNVSAGTVQDELDAEKTLIKLEENVTDDITIAADKVVTLDLNGKTFTGSITVLGELTIKDSGNGGKASLSTRIKVGDETKDIAGKFTLESGKIESLNSYGVYAVAGSTVTINGGEIESKNSALGGNNTKGTVYFNINGGTLTTKEGPSIYMPTPVALTITDGTLNGGIFVRMGKINISGGVINGTTENLDNVKDYYVSGQNVWLGDALYVWGGTYTTTAEVGNVLEVNITGGTLNATKGYAVAIYDMAKVAQNMSVKISDKAVLNGEKGSYTVLALDAEELGIETINTAFNKAEYVGKVSTSITGGTFAKAVDAKYLTDGYVQDKNTDGKYVVAKEEVNVEVPAFKETEEVKEVTVGVSASEELEKTLKESLGKIDVEDTNAIIEVNVAKAEEKDLDTKTKEDFEKYVSENNSVKISEYFDITILVKNNVTDEELGEISETSKKITFKVALTEELLNVEDGYTRTYYILRYHDGKVEKLDASLVGNILTFESDKFSTYAVAYEDKVKETSKEEVENPKTSDSIVLTLVVGAMAISGASVVGYKLKKRLG